MESDDLFKGVRDPFDELIDKFENSLKIPNIGIRFGAELTSPTGETVKILGDRVLPKLRQYQQTIAQEQTLFDTSELQALIHLLS